MSQKSNPRTNIGNEIKKAIRHLRESKGSSFADIKKYLSVVYQTKGMNMPDYTSRKIYLKNAVDKGTLLKLDNGNYKIKENARRKKSNRSCSRDNKPSKRSKSKKSSGEIRRSVSGSKKPGRPCSTKETSGSEKMNLRKKSKRKSSKSPMPVKKKQATSTKNRAETQKKRVKRKTKENTSISDYNDEPGYEDADIKGRKELLDEIPRSLSGSKKRGRPSNAKQDMGSEKKNLPKKETSPPPMPVKKKQTPLTTKRAVTPKKVDKRKIKEGTPLCDFSEEPNFQSTDIESRKKFSDEMSQFLSGSKKTGQPRSTKQAMGSEKLNLPKTKRSISEANPEEEGSIGQEKSCNTKKMNTRKKEKASSLTDYNGMPDYEDSDFESRKEFSGKVRFSLSGSEKSGRPSNANQATRSEKLYLRNNKRKRSPSSIPIKKKKMTPAAKKRASTPKKVEKRKKKKGSRSI